MLSGWALWQMNRELFILIHTKTPFEEGGNLFVCYVNKMVLLLFTYDRQMLRK